MRPDDTRRTHRAALAAPITDRIALGALTSTFPPDLVDRTVQQTGRAEQRRRLLPARVVVYFVLALALYSHAAYEEVMRCLVEGLGWAVGARRGRRSWPYWHVPGASALGEARERLGAEPLKELFAQAARPLATAATRGAWYGRRRLLVLDGTCLDTPDTPENDAALGRPGTGRGQGMGAFPMVRVVGLVEGGTHAIVDAVQGPYTTSEQALARQLARDGGRLGPGVLLLADRLFVGWELWQAMAGTGAELLWRVKCGQGAPSCRSSGSLVTGRGCRTCAPRMGGGSPSGSSSTAFPILGGAPVSTATGSSPRSGTHPGACRGAGGAGYRAVGDPDRAGRAEDDPARPQAGAALPHPRAGRAGGLGAPAGPLRAAGGDAQRRLGRGPGP